MRGMKECRFLFCLMSCCTFVIVSAIHPSNFRKTKAEDNEGGVSLPSDQTNLLADCDMTPQFCDINCCSDQDCSEEDKISFICSDEGHAEVSQFYYLDCNNIDSSESIGNPILCLQDQNSPYLGDYYMENDNISDYNFFQILASQNKGISTFRIIDLPANNSEYKYKYGSKIFLHDSKGQNHNINILSNIFNKGNGYCSKVPLRFLTNEVSNCFFLINEEQCLLNTELHLQHHMNTLNRIEYLGDINNVNVTYTVACLRDGNNFILFSKNMFKTVKENLPINDEVINCESDLSTRINERQALCENVVVGLNYDITVNGSILISINVNIYIANIPFNEEGFLLMHTDMFTVLNTFEKGAMYALQKITVTFKDINKTKISNEGYSPGQPVFSSR